MSRFAIRGWFISPANGLVAAIILILLAVTVISTNGAQATSPGKVSCERVGANASRLYRCNFRAGGGPANQLEFDLISPDKTVRLVNKVTVVTNPASIPAPVAINWEVAIGGTKAAPNHGYANTTVYGDCNVAHTTDNHVSLRRKAGAPNIVKGDWVSVNIFLCPPAIKALEATDVRWQLAGAPVPQTNATPTNAPTATPKPVASGVLSGVSDIWVTGGVYPNPYKGYGIFHCISYTAHEAQGGAPTIERIKTAATCFGDTNIGDPGDALRAGNDRCDVAPCYPPGEGPDLQPGPPPPPPYGTGAPAKGSGTYNEVTDKLISDTCFSNQGGTLGPNIIWMVEIQNAQAQLTNTGKQQGSLIVYINQTNKQCRDLTPAGATYLSSVLNIKIQPADKDTVPCSPNCVRVPWRSALPAGQDPAGADNTDYDNDGCTDRNELDKLSTAKCGQNPWNPYDSGPASGDLNGVWYVLITARPADSCRNNTWDGQLDVPQLYNCNGQPDGTFVPGAYYHCYTYINQPGAPGSKNLTADALCYIDFGPNTLLHPIAGVAPGPGTPLSVNPEQCAAAGLLTVDGKDKSCTGDGKVGAAPPGNSGWGSGFMFADIDSKHTHLTGRIDNVKNTINLEGCFPDTDSRGALEWVYAKLILDRHTRQGKVDLWTFQTQANCENGTPAPGFGILPPQALPVQAVKESGDPLYDADQDGCPSAMELSDDPVSGGLRDPSNPWDYFNPLNNDINRTGDITAVVNHYGHDADPPGDLQYGKKYDRGGSIAGSNKWNMQPPDGIIRTADITAAVNAYGHDCGTAVNKTPVPTRTPRPQPTKSPMPPTKTP